MSPSDTSPESGTTEAGLGPDPSLRSGPPVSGEASTEGAVAPPYEGRTTRRATGDADEPAERQQRAEGAYPGSRTEELTDPDSTPGGRTESPADEQPAAEQAQTRESDAGVGPAHYAGTPRGEDEAEAPEPGREDTGTEGAAQRPTGESTGRAATAVDEETTDASEPDSDKEG
jgi:hypothetical protein